MTDFKSLELIPSLMQAIEATGYDTPTPIQEESIPYLLKGRDLLGIAQTGTGKTAAFALPILQYLSNNPINKLPSTPRVLILSPTRELALQISESVETYGKYLKHKSSVIFGGVNQNPQVKALKQGLDILVATPGRLLDLMNQGEVKLGKLEIFVLDEADRMLDMGFINDVKKIITKVPVKRQTLLFSATMPQDIARLAGQLLRNPAKVEVTPPSTTVDRISQKLLLVKKEQKPGLLRHLLEQDNVEQALVFAQTKRGADKVVRDLQKCGIACDAIHGNKSQPQRVRALDAFRKGKTKVLIATDIAARGIDVVGVSHVINYNLPNEPESYVHRIGRTARAGREGIAISLCDPTERSLLHAIERVIKRKIPIDVKLASQAGLEHHKMVSESHDNSFHKGQGLHHQPSTAPKKVGRKLSAPVKSQRRSFL